MCFSDIRYNKILATYFKRLVFNVNSASLQHSNSQ